MGPIKTGVRPLYTGVGSVRTAEAGIDRWGRCVRWWGRTRARCRRAEPIFILIRLRYRHRSRLSPQILNIRASPAIIEYNTQRVQNIT